VSFGRFRLFQSSTHPENCENWAKPASKCIVSARSRTPEPETLLSAVRFLRQRKAGTGALCFPVPGETNASRKTRYYFNVVTNTANINDPEGMELPSDEAALIEAMIVIAQLRRDFPGQFGEDASLQVSTGRGPILSVPFLINGKVPEYVN
jgi:hypothetical protein